jgi:hypothetical protein
MHAKIIAVKGCRIFASGRVVAQKLASSSYRLEKLGNISY